MNRKLFTIFELPTFVDGVERITITIHIGKRFFAGQLVLCHLNNKAAAISMVYVVPTQRRIGLCRRMFERAYKIARERGCETIGLIVQAKNETAIIAYECLGFKCLYDYDDGQLLYVREIHTYEDHS